MFPEGSNLDADDLAGVSMPSKVESMVVDFPRVQPDDFEQWCVLVTDLANGDWDKAKRRFNRARHRLNVEQQENYVSPVAVQSEAPDPAVRQTHSSR